MCRRRPFATHRQRPRPARAAVCRIPCRILCLAYVERVGQCREERYTRPHEQHPSNQSRSRPDRRIIERRRRGRGGLDHGRGGLHVAGIFGLIAGVVLGTVLAGVLCGLLALLINIPRPAGRVSPAARLTRSGPSWSGRATRSMEFIVGGGLGAERSTVTPGL